MVVFKSDLTDVGAVWLSAFPKEAKTFVRAVENTVEAWIANQERVVIDDKSLSCLVSDYGWERKKAIQQLVIDEAIQTLCELPEDSPYFAGCPRLATLLQNWEIELHATGYPRDVNESRDDDREWLKIPTDWTK